MMRLTGNLIFSLLFFLPLGAEGKVKESICPTGSTDCVGCGCVVIGSPCPPASCQRKVVPLTSKEPSIYSLEEGAIVTCEGNKLTAHPPDKDGTIYWTC